MAIMLVILEFIISAVLCTFLPVYLYRTRLFKVWKNQGIPHLPGTFPFGSYGLRNKKDLIEIETENYAKYGKIYGRFDGDIPVLTVAEPTMINKIMMVDFPKFPNRRDIRLGDPIFDKTLFSLEDEDWKRVREVVSAGFRNSLRMMTPMLLNCCDQLIETVDEDLKETQVINCQKYFGVFVLQAIGRCAFGVKIERHDPFIDNANKLFSDNWKTILIVCFPEIVKPFKLSILNKQTMDFYRNVMMTAVEDRKKRTDVKYNDFLQALIDRVEENNNVLNSLGLKGITEEELLATNISFFLAGYDVTTSLLSHSAYRLALDQECQQRIFEEARAALRADVLQIEDEAKKNEALSMCLNKMKYIESFMYECLRICPPLTRIERRAAEDYDFPECQLKKDFLVSIPVYAMHHDPELYPDPEIFDPERFMDGPREFKDRFFPFGGGQRKCVGMNFVIMQFKLFLSMFVLNYKIFPTETTPKTLKIIEMRNVLKVDDVDVRLEKRES